MVRSLLVPSFLYDRLHTCMQWAISNIKTQAGAPRTDSIGREISRQPAPSPARRSGGTIRGHGRKFAQPPGLGRRCPPPLPCSTAACPRPAPRQHPGSRAARTTGHERRVPATGVTHLGSTVRARVRGRVHAPPTRPQHQSRRRSLSPTPPRSNGVRPPRNDLERRWRGSV